MRKLFLIIFIIVLILFGLNIRVSTRQGIDGKVKILKIPLYLKMLDFFDRHFNYIELTKKITDGAETDEEKVVRIFNWTHQNIRKVPQGLPVVDDHLWYVIVRGYGAGDQTSDVFTTLCNYAGIPAFYSYVYSGDKITRTPISFVLIGRKWTVFDPYRGAQFKTKEGQMASIEILKSGNNWIVELSDITQGIDYSSYFSTLPTITEIKLSKANIQSPFRRFIYEVHRIISKK